MSQPWMPLYIADYLRDTAHLQARESGAYLHLIMAYWANGKLPNDDRQLAMIAKMSPAQWRAARVLVEPFFGVGFISHKRIDKELARSVEVSASYAARASQAAKKRWEKHTSSNATGMLENAQPQLQSHTPEAKASGGVAPKKLRKRKAETSLPDDWAPTSDDRDYGKGLGLSEKEIGREIERFRNNARSKDRRLSDWGMGFRNWLLKAAEFLGREPFSADTIAVGTDGFYAPAGSQELEAWDDFRQRSEGKSYPRDAKGGWHFPGQWPPEIGEAAA